nr:J538 [uncultured bacterium]
MSRWSSSSGRCRNEPSLSPRRGGVLSRDIRAEARLLRMCVREPEEVTDDEILTAAKAVRDWHWLAGTADQHGIVRFLIRAVTSRGLTLPQQASDMLHESAIAQTAMALSLESELARVLESLEGAGVPAIVIKGPALARTLYDDSLLRPFSDLDLVVQSRDQAIAANGLQDCGYTETAFGPEADRQAHAGHVHEGAEFHRVFQAPCGSSVELHLDPLQLGLRPACEEGRWLRAVPVAGLPRALMLCPEDQLVQLATHVHKHGFCRLIWLKDIDLLVRRYFLDWALVREVARAEGVGASVWYSLRLSRLLLGTPVPGSVLANFRPALPLRFLYQWVWPPARILNLGGFMRRRSVQFHMAQSWSGMLPSLILMGRRADRMHALLKMTVHVSPADVSSEVPAS